MIKCTLINNETGEREYKSIKVLKEDYEAVIQLLKENNIKYFKEADAKNNDNQGVYKIIHTPTGRLYIGSSKDIKKRWKEHTNDLIKNEHHSYKLQEAWNKCIDPINSFKFEIIDLVEESSELFDIEQYWINHYNAYSDENFNVMKIAGATKILNANEKEKAHFEDYQKNELGSFIFFLYNSLDELTNNLNDNDLFKLLYISTYIKYNGILMLDNNHTYITKKKLKELLNVSESTFSAFYNKLITHKILIKDENKFYISLKYFYKGSINQYKVLTNNSLNNYTRIYINPIRELYNNTDVRHQKTLADIIKLIPYINIKYNILCKNPKEKFLTDIKPLSTIELAEVMNKNHSNILRHIRQINRIKINREDIIKFNSKDKNIRKRYFIINPKIIYSNGKINDLEYVINLFSEGEDILQQN